MKRLRPSLDRSLHRNGDPYDEGPLPDLTSGLMWLATGMLGLIVQQLPGTPDDHTGWVYGLCTFALAWGAFSMLLGVRRWTMSLRWRAALTASMMPLVGVALWVTGGASSYMQTVLLFTALFVGWFFPPRLAWPLVVLFLASYASPLVYDPAAVDLSFPARVVESLTEQIERAEMPEGIDEVGVTFAWAVSPTDAEDGEDLLQRADERLLASKRAAKLAEPVF